MLADVLKLLRMRAEVYHNAKVCGEWLIPEGHLGQTCFHMPTEGECLLLLPGRGEVALHTGDLLIFPREVPHSMMPSSPQSGPEQHLPYAQAPISGTGMLCGRMHFQHQAHMAILNALPEHLIIREADSKEWLPPLLELVLYESYKLQQCNLMLDRLCEMIFMYALTHYSGSKHPSQGILMLYGVEKLTPAITAIHRQVAYPWTLELLAKSCHMSRTAFAALFKQSGWTAMRYLTWWRMQLAYQYLAQGDAMADIAERVGYSSEPAFSRAFHKEFSVRPGQVRRRA